jgi:predicted nucleotidyltransferase component of viral defense system
MRELKKFFALSKEEQKLAIIHVATVKGLPSMVVEKDLWVTVILHLLFGKGREEGLVFKGGTSLSKGFSIIQRFSEDIDITLKTSLLEKHFGTFDFDNPLEMWDKEWSGNKLKRSLEKLQVLSQKYVDEVMLSYLKTQLHLLIGKEVTILSEGEMTLNVYYPKVLDNQEYGGEYIHPIVKIEVGVRSTPEPNIVQPIQSFIEEVKEEAEPVEVTILRPDRTFWEKVTILHAENSRNQPERIQKRNRMSRHLYDIVKLYASDFGKEAVANKALLDKVVQHKTVFFKDNRAKYEEATPEKLRLVPKGEMLKRFREDYDDMAKVMFSQEPPHFDEVLQVLEEIEEKIRRL